MTKPRPELFHRALSARNLTGIFTEQPPVESKSISAFFFCFEASIQLNKYNPEHTSSFAETGKKGSK
eukprot:CAMPEP_0197188466 /NCGR_PEP_ID=MMETSP1423-20130617/17847_1 /TAXON_ID=476441 /ORGANISM="Pseudo-nitzschia heimii, Strain UNC1101" /LENGTH=66 /DNA_ID=CAMNT_0042640303 /DNA_START=124 /DNA_END=324 /DNA_ORIENTATION=-